MKNLMGFDSQSSAVFSSQTVSQINTNFTKIIISHQNSQIDDETCKMLLQNDLDILKYLETHLPLYLRKVSQEITKRIEEYVSNINTYQQNK